MHQIFKNLSKQKLIFYPCPKNANISAKLFFLKHLGTSHKVYFSNFPMHDRLNRNKEKIKLHDKIDIITIFPSYIKFKKYNADFKCCIIRNPFERFISCYTNRILYHKDKDFKDFDIDKILSYLNIGKFTNNHFLPQCYFLGNDLNYFEIVGDVKNLNSFINKINNFFNKRIDFPRMHINKINYNISLSQEQKNKIQNIYSKDFDLYEQKK